MKPKPTTADPILAFRSKHEQLDDVYYIISGSQLITVQAREISRQSMSRRNRARHIDRADVAQLIATSIETVAHACNPLGQLKHLWIDYRATACGVPVGVGKRAASLAEVNCPDCLIRMYKTAIVNPLIGKAIGAQ